MWIEVALIVGYYCTIAIATYVATHILNNHFDKMQKELDEQLMSMDRRAKEVNMEVKETQLKIQQVREQLCG